MLDPGSEIRDPGWIKLGSGINIPNPQHCFVVVAQYGKVNYYLILQKDYYAPTSSYKQRILHTSPYYLGTVPVLKYGYLLLKIPVLYLYIKKKKNFVRYCGINQIVGKTPHK
jgi:hypothetical protein